MLIRVRLKRDLGARTVSLEVDPTKESLSDLRKKLYNYISSEYRFSKDSIHPIKNEKCPLQDIGLDEEDAFTLCLIPPNFEPNLDIGDFNFPIETTPTKINSGTTPRSASHTSELIIKAVTERPPLPQGVLSTSNFGNFLRQNSSESKVGVVKSDSGVASSGDCVSFLCEALHMMMLDSGFSNKKDQNEQEQLKSLNRYQYIAPFGPIIPIEMVCTSLGPNLITHGSYIQQNFIRSAIIRHMPTMENRLRSWLTPYNSVKEYIAGEGMDKNYTWAGDIEMLTMADLLNVYIYSYNEEGNAWVRYSPLTRNADPNSPAIYLTLVNMNHYRVVTSIADKEIANTNNSGDKNACDDDKKKENKKSKKNDN